MSYRWLQLIMGVKKLICTYALGGVPQNVQGATEEEGSTNLILFTYITYGMVLNWGIGFEVNDF